MRERHLDAISLWIASNGLTALTLDEAAGAAGLTPEELRGYFDSKVEVVLALIARARSRYRHMFTRLLADTTLTQDERRRKMWQHFLDSETDFRIFFEAYGLALHDDTYSGFIHGIDDWLNLIRDTTEATTQKTGDSVAYVTLLLAIYRGAMLDYCATGARARVNAAMELWFKAAKWLHGEDVPLT